MSIAMPKLKTNRSIAKRFRVTGTGKLKRARGFKNHILTKKRSKRKAFLSKAGYVEGERFKKMIQTIQK